MEDDRFENILPSNENILSRANTWMTFEEVFMNAKEDTDQCIDFSEESCGEEEEESNSDRSIEVGDQSIENTALVEYFSPKKLFKTRLLPLIRRENNSLTEKIRRMEFQGKVMDWLKNNAQHMGNPLFSDTDRISGRFRMRKFSSTDMDMHTGKGYESNGSSASVDTAAYILANRKHVHRSRIRVTTIKEYSILEQDTDLLRFDREHPWQPIAIPRRPLALEHPNGRRFPPEDEPRTVPAIEYPQSLRQTEKNPPQRDNQKHSKRKRRRCTTPVERSSSKSSDSQTISNALKSPEKIPRRETDRPAESKTPSGKPSEVVIYKPEKAFKWDETVQITLEMLVRKVGKSEAESVKNHPFLRFPMPASSTLVYNPTTKTLKELMRSPNDSGKDDTDEDGEDDWLTSKQSNARRHIVEDDIVIHKPTEKQRKSHKTIRITPDILQRKLDKDTFKKIMSTPYLRFPFPEASTLLFNRHTEKLYEKIF